MDVMGCDGGGEAGKKDRKSGREFTLEKAEFDDSEGRALGGGKWSTRTRSAFRCQDSFTASKTK